jgi:N-acetylglucosamine-6-phosphate deacetylase
MRDPAPQSVLDSGQVLEGRLIEDGAAVQIAFKDGVITELVRVDTTDSEMWIAPGWIDLQVNGYSGHDPNAEGAEPEATADMVRSLWRHGVTALCPTITTASEAQIISALGAIASACDADPLVAASILGIHVEGPHISSQDGPRGAHPRAHVRPPDIKEYRRWQAAAGGRVKIITLSPEYPEAIDYVQAIVADGVVASIGHTAASAEQIRAAVDAGARWSTHLGNGAHEVLPRHPNYIWEQLADDRLSAGFIFDGQHLSPSFMRAALRAKGIERSILVTDAVALAGRPPGVYESSSGAIVELSKSGRLTVQGTSYQAGSTASLPICLTNALRHAGLTLAQATRMVTANPSTLVQLPSRSGHDSVRRGSDANLTIFRHVPGTFDIDVVETIVAGTVVFGPRDRQMSARRRATRNA